MTDIVISYSQRFPEPTEALAADLRAMGYAHWFDTRLLPNQVFWRVIMKRITDAKAMIVIWSPPAVESDWVYGEAKLAHEQRKLICVRTAEVPATSVPIPFNGYNVSLVTDRLRVYEALDQLGVRAEGAVRQVAAVAATAVIAPPIALSDHEVSEIALAWASIKDLGDADDFAAFLNHYGTDHAFFARLAEKRMKTLCGGQPGAIPSRPSATVVSLPATPSKAVQAEIATAAENVVLRIEAGMHTARIGRISLTADGRLMATASDDKTARLWSLPDGRLIRTLRPPIGPGNDGKVYAVALAPDGSWVAVGGSHTSGEHWVFIFSAATGAVITRLGPLPSTVHDLEVSQDGDRLAAGLRGTVSVWETQGWRQVVEDRDIGDRVSGLSFAPDGRLAATSYDGYIRLYDGHGHLAEKGKAPGGARPCGIAFSPNGAQLAIGYDDNARVDVLSAQTLAHLFSLDTSIVDNGDLGTVAWLLDGVRIAAAGGFEAKGKRPIPLWSEGGKGRRQLLPGPANTVQDLAPWGEGLAFGASGPAFGLLNANGKRVLFRGPPMADLRNKRGERFTVSRDGRRVRFALRGSDDPWLFDLSAVKLTPAPAASAELQAADIRGLSVTGWEGTTEPKLLSKALTLENYETSRSLAIAPDAQSFVLGADWSLRRFDKDGKQLWEKPVPGIAYGVNMADEGRLILAAYADGTIRWHRAADGEELLALFVHLPNDRKAGKHWVLWTPEGYYTASPGAEDLIGWHVNRGPDQAADFYPAETFRSTFHKPDMVAQALDKVDPIGGVEDCSAPLLSWATGGNT